MIKNGNIILRAVEPNDVDLLYKWENDMELWQVSNTLVPFSKYQLMQFVKSTTLDIYHTRQLRLMIDVEDVDSVQTAGMIDLFDFDPFHNRGGIGIMVHEKWRNKRIASESLRLFINYASENIGIHNFYCNILTTNEASIRLFVGLGFELAGRKKEWLKINGKYEDELMYQLITSSGKGNSASSL